MRRMALAAGMLSLCLGWTLPAGADELFYYVEGGDVIITNTPSRPDVRIVPGFEETLGVRSADLPATAYDSLIESVAREAGLSPRLVKAVAWVESGLDPEAVSPKGAMGLMQLMPATARMYGVDQPFDPYQNLRAGARHLRKLLDRFDGDLSLALAAYNAGERAVRRAGGVPDFKETREYVRKVHGRLGRAPRRATAPTALGAGVRIQMGRDGSVLLTN